MRIAVLGTSNSILKTGYVKELKKYKNIEVDSFGIGDVSSLYGIYKLASDNNILDNYDYCILDYSMNEYLYINQNFITNDRVIFYIMCIMSLFNCKKAIPIFILLSPMNIDTINNDLYRKIFKYLNVRFIDFDKIFYILKDNKIYESTSHYIPEFQKAIADKIYIECLNEKNSNINFSYINNNPINISLFMNNNINKDMIECVECEKSTSLINVKTVCMDKKSYINIRTNKYLLGCVFWNTDEGADVYFKSNDINIKKNFHLKWGELLSCRSILCNIYGDVEILLKSDDALEESVPNSVHSKFIDPKFYLCDFIFSDVDPINYVKKLKLILNDIKVDEYKFENIINNEIIFNNKKHIYVPYEKSDSLIIALNTHNQRDRYFQYASLIKNQKCNLLFICDPNNTFYMDKNCGENYSLLLDKYINKFKNKKVTILGSSMAGYAALYFGILKNINIICNNPLIDLNLSKEFSWNELKNTINSLGKYINLNYFIPNNIKDSVIYSINGDYIMDKINSNLLRNCFLNRGRIFIEKIEDDEHGYALKDASKIFKIHEIICMLRDIHISKE